MARRPLPFMLTALCLLSCATSVTCFVLPTARSSRLLQPFRPAESFLAPTTVLEKSKSHGRGTVRTSAVAAPRAASMGRAMLAPTRQAIRTLWDFSRPHTVIGTTVSAASLFCYATPPAKWISKDMGASFLGALLPSLLMNVYITGLNQIIDVDIDKINKPFLPIAAGVLSVPAATAVVLGSLVGALLSAQRALPPLRWTLLLSALVGTLYSMPPVRLKKFPFFAALCILVVRGAFVNIGFYHQARVAVMHDSPPSSVSAALRRHPESVGVAFFFAVFGLAIAILKDIPDITGDKSFDIVSFSVSQGAQAMLNIGWRMLTGLLWSTAIVCTSRNIRRTQFEQKGEIGRQLLRLVLPSMLLWLGWRVRTNALGALREDSTVNMKNVYSFYMYVWKVFYACYALLPMLQF